MNAGGSSEILVLMHTITWYYRPEECPDGVYLTYSEDVKKLHTSQRVASYFL
jgi:hypothetical protein